MKSTSRTLMLRIEPTPYILALIEHASARWPSGIEVLFLGENLTQPWSVSLESIRARILPTGFLSAFREILRMIRSKEYAIIHIAGWGRPILIATMLVAAWYRIPIAIDSDTPEPPRQSWWKRKVKRLLYPHLFKLTSVFLPAGKRQSAYLQSFGVPLSRIRIAQMTVDTAAIETHRNKLDPISRAHLRKSRSIPANAVVFLYVGRLEPHKGINVLLDAYKQLYDLNTYLLIVGAGSLSTVVEVAATEVAQIHFAGRLSGEALLDTYCIADACVVPSLFEPWGLVVNEAMAAGLPVIATNRVGCIDDLVIDAETGLIVAAGSVDELAGAMKRIAADDSLRTALGSNGLFTISKWTLVNQSQITCSAWEEAIG